MNRHVLILILLALVSFFLNLGGSSVYILDEAKNAGCAMEMQQRNDWVVPTFNNELRTDKPPLHYYFMRTAYTLFGVTPFAARCFSAVMAMLLVLTLYRFGKKYLTAQSAFYACVILICSLQVAIQFRLAVPDPYLIAFLTLALLLFYDGYASGKTSPLLFSYGALALATLAKGPVAVLFYALVVLIFLLVTRSFSMRRLLELKVPAGIFLFLVIVLPWYILVGIQTDGEWLEQFFFKHNLGRFTDTMEGHRGFPLASLAVLIFGLMPFSFYMPEMLKTVWKARRQHELLTFCLIAVTVVVMFFAFSRTFLPGYVAPAFPFFALLLGYYWDAFVRSGKTGVGVVGAAYFAILAAVALCIGLWKGIELEPALATLKNIWVCALILVAGSTAALILLYRGLRQHAFVSYALASISFVAVFFVYMFPRIDALNPVNQSLPLVQHNPVAYYRAVNPAFVFALQRPIPKLENPEELTVFLSQPDHRVITTQKSLKQIDTLSYTILFRQKDLFERSTTVIIMGKH